MMAASHRLGGAAMGMLAAHVLTGPGDITGKAVILSAAVLGSLIPDIDHPYSSISRKHRGIRGAVGLVQITLRGISGLLPRRQGNYLRTAAGHRGASHSLLMAAACVLLVHMGVLICPAWKGMITLAAWGVGAGVLSHLLLDLFAGGVPLLFPFSGKRIALARIKTGGVTEWIIRILSAGILAILTGAEIAKWI